MATITKMKPAANRIPAYKYPTLAGVETGFSPQHLPRLLDIAEARKCCFDYSTGGKVRQFGGRWLQTPARPLAPTIYKGGICKLSGMARTCKRAPLRA